MSIADESIVERLFHEALELPAAERAAFVESQAPDAAVRDEVLALLAADTEPAAPLRATADELAAAAGLLAGPLTGRTFGRYRVLEPIGQGGMGTVYLAVRDDLGGRVALKVIRGALGDPVRLARFRQEQRVLARLEHDHIARLIDAGVAPDETPYLVMEYVEGTPITEWCDRRGLGVEARLRLFLDVCDAVAFAHRHAIVHRDIKPSNVLVTEDGRVKLLDFGVAKLLEEDDVDTALTATTARILSPMHAAPEQLLGEPVTTATDVHGLGALLYELLAGRPPRELAGSGPGAWIAAAANDVVPPSVAARRAEAAANAGVTNAGSSAPARRAAPINPRRIAGDLDAICLRALEREPARRYTAVELLREDIARHLDGRPVEARLPTLAYRAGKFARRHALTVGSAATIVVLLTGALGAVTWQARQAERARDVAEELADFLVGLFGASDPEETRGRTVTARELLAEGTARAHELDDRPEVQIRLLDAMARAHLGLGDYALADSLAALALERARAVHGERAAEYADRLATLAHARRAVGRELEAETLMRETLELRRRTLGPRHDLTTRSMLDLAWLLHERTGFDEAEALARQALEARIDRYGPEHDDVAIAMETLATILWYSGRDIAQAETLYREAAELRERLWGPDDLRVAGSLVNLAGILPVVGKGEEAEAVARRALEIRRDVYGDEHPLTISVLNQIGRALQSQGRPAEARVYFAEILRRYQGLYPGDHTYLATTLNNLSSTFYEESALDSAEHYLRQALEMRVCLFGPMDASVGMYQHNLGSLLHARGDFAAAEPELAEAYRIRAAVHGEDNPIALRTGAAHGSALAELGRLDEAERILRDILRRQQDPDFGVPVDAARTMGYLAGVLARRGEYAEAEALYLPALEMARERMAPTHPRRRELAEGLAKLYEAWGRPEEAARVGLFRESGFGSQDSGEASLPESRIPDPDSRLNHNNSARSCSGLFGERRAGGMSSTLRAPRSPARCSRKAARA